MTKKQNVFLLVCIFFILVSLPVLFTSLIDLNVLSAKKRLQHIHNIELVNLWGHRDWRLEEISVRLKIKNKGEIVLYGISDYVYNYPNSVKIIEIGNLSFAQARNYNGQLSYGNCIDIGKSTYLGQRLGLIFNSIQDVIDHYDSIVNFFKTFKQYPQVNYFLENKNETFLIVFNKKSCNIDPLALLFDNSYHNFIQTLPWKNYQYKSTR